MALPRQVNIVEVGPRDGLQDEKTAVEVGTKAALIEKLAAAGIGRMEAGSFVSPKWVPQMAGTDELFNLLPQHSRTAYIALTPNLTGLQRALDCGARNVGFFVAASESFNRNNLNSTIAETLKRFASMMQVAEQHSLSVRGYVSCVVACPYEGDISPAATAAVATQLLDLGCNEISLCDTLGVGNPNSISRMLEAAMQNIPLEKISLHQHDTYGQALVNIHTALQMGVSTFDSSVAGLGGCPYARGAAGNVATEDLVCMLDGLGIQHGIDLEKLVEAGQFICKKLGRKNGSKVALAIAANSQH